MSISMSSACLPVCISMLGNLNHLLSKAQAFVDTKKCDPAALTQYRLAPDMLPFTMQILIACDMAKNGVANLSGVEAPKFDNTETTIAELQARIQKTLAYLTSVPATALDGSEEKDVTFPVGPNATRTLKGETYLKHNMLPNMYFHITTAYAILRHNGVELGKRDFLMGATA